jgi:RNA polymerase sigma factor (sigma-70 family)
VSGGPEAPAPSDEALMEAYRAGDGAAFEALFRRYAERLLQFFGRYGERGGTDAGDLVQKTFLHVHRARHDFDRGRAFRPWLYTIALNVRREEGRRRLRKREVAVDFQEPGGPEPAVEPSASSASDRLVRRALGLLSASQREVVILHWFEGLSFPEIAEMLGATNSAVKVRAHRAYGELKKLLGGEEGAP